MTQIRGYIGATRRPGELGIHSLDHFSLNVPDLGEADKFYRSFGIDVEEESANLVLRAGARKHAWGVLAEGAGRSLRYLSFGAFEDDLPRFRQRLDELKIPRLDPPPGFEYKSHESEGLWFRDQDGNLIEIKAAEKVSPNAKTPFSMGSCPGGVRGVKGRAAKEFVKPHRLAHVLLFTTDVGKAIEFYHRVLGLRLTDRGGEGIAFMHGIHGSDHHLVAFGLSAARGFHHVSWGVESINEVGLGAMQMADKGYNDGWGLLRHVLGSNYSHYIKDPWGSYSEYTCDIDYIPCTHDWEAGQHPADDAVYLWGPNLPADFIVNTEAPVEKPIATSVR